MPTLISRRSFIARVGAVGAVAGTGISAPGMDTRAQDGAAPGAPANPDPQHIQRQGGGWRVLPNGVDDQSNLEWVLNNTAPGGTVRLAAGTFKLGRPVNAVNFDGRVTGAGRDRTTITCADHFSYELWEAPGGGKEIGEPEPPPFPRASISGSATRTAPGYLLFFKTPLQPGENPQERANRIEIRDLRFRSTAIGELWMFGDSVLAINIINSMDWHNPEIEHATTRQDVLVSGVEVEGYSSAAFGPFESSCGCVAVLGGIVLTANYNLEGPAEDGDANGFENGGLLGIVPAEGDVTISSCTFRNCRVGPGLYGLKNSVLTFENNTTDGCRANCHQLWDISGCKVLVRNNDLHCDPFLLPPELAGGATDVPSSLGCVIVMQGIEAGVGYMYNRQWLELASQVDDRPSDAGPPGTWRPRGPATAPEPSEFRILDNRCTSSVTPNTYCLHVVDAAKKYWGMETVLVRAQGNTCDGSDTCVSFEHVDNGQVVNNACSSQAYGVELYDSPAAMVSRNTFEFTEGAGCEIRTLFYQPPLQVEKIDFYRVAPGVPERCVPQ